MSGYEEAINACHVEKKSACQYMFEHYKEVFPKENIELSLPPTDHDTFSTQELSSTTDTSINRSMPVDAHTRQLPGYPKCP